MRVSKRQSRGVILLVVLSLLVLFMVLTVTFVVVTGHYKRTSQSYARIRRTSSQNTIGSLADNVVYQLIRDTRTSSAFRNQSLLGDLYGNDGFIGFVVGSQAHGIALPGPPAVSLTAQQIELTAQIDPRNANYSQVDSLIRLGLLPNGCFNGRVLTIINSVWVAGVDGRWGQAGTNDDGFGPLDDIREAGYGSGLPGSDDKTMSGRMWTQGDDLRWGVSGTDDDGDGTTDNFSEAGYSGSDDLLIPFTDPGPDGAWGMATINDDGDPVTDNSREANWPGSNDRRASPVASTRIIKSQWQFNSAVPPRVVGLSLIVEPFPDIAATNQYIPTLGQRFIINGAPFNGTGLGFHRSTQGLDLNVPISPGLDVQWGVAGVDDDRDGSFDEPDEAGAAGSDDIAFPIALAQNFNTYRPTLLGTPLYNLSVTPDFAGFLGVFPNDIPNATAGGTDESYDVPDYQNMFLSRTIPTTTSPAGIIPSFHRPELVNYLFNWVVSNLFWDPAGNTWWVNPPDHWAMFMAPMGLDGQPGTGDEPASNPGWPPPYRQLVRDLKRWCIFRPLPDDHPNFVSPTDQTSWLGFSDANSRLINGPYDVDNDRDGIADSIWTDGGLPPVRLPDGRLVKPMVAIQVEDLDNRLDMNVHGGLENNVVQRTNTYNFHPGRDGRWGWAGVDDNGDGTVDDIGERGMNHPTTGLPSDDAKIAGTALPSLPLPSGAGIARGLGVGASEISLRPLFEYPDSNNPTTTNPSYPNDLLAVINERYRRIGSPTIMPGQNDGADDELSLVRDFHLPIRYWNTGFARTSYSTPPDMRGLSSILLDLNGQPIHVYAGIDNEVVDDPYELGVGGDSYRGRTGGDNTYTLNDLERILRWQDHDAQLLSPRLADLAPQVFRHASARRLVTTLTSHIPSPNVGVPRDQRDWAQFPSPPFPAANYWKNRAVILGIPAPLPVTPTTSPTISDLFFARFAAGGMLTVNWAVQLDLMLPFELRKGQPFDVNRVFGNGRDDDGDGIVDEPTEPIDVALLGGFESAWTDPNLPNYDFAANSQFPGRRFLGSNARSVNGTFVDPLSDPARYQGFPTNRQVYARHLYCLMMLLVDQNFVSPTAETLPLPPPETPRRQLARRVAQWAVNVVDFRDADAIMTPFEYDVDPFNANGWVVDGIVGHRRVPGVDGTWGTADDGWVDLDSAIPDRDVVWGCEAPDLLITETLSFHDRCVVDSAFDDGMNGNGDTSPPSTQRSAMPPVPTEDWDQYRKPQGSLFIELYCARNPERFDGINDMYGNTRRLPQELYNASGNLELTRMAPATTGGLEFPVWRIAVTKPATSAAPAPNAHLMAQHEAYDVASAPASLFDTSSFHPDSFGLDPKTPQFHPVPTANQIDRIIWMAPPPQPIASYPEGSRVFYGRSGPSVGLPPNRYVVIGPRVLTPLGSKDDMDSDYSTHMNSPHALSLAAGTFSATNNAMPAVTTTPVVGNAIQPPVGIICAADAPAIWMEPTYQVGMNVSEPLSQSGSYYSKPFDLVTGSYFNPASTTSLPDTPFDEDPANSTYPLVAETVYEVQTGTRRSFRSVYLQRLADPTIAWNPEPGHPDHDPSIPCNPYVSVDWSTLDLTVFNGDQTTAGAPLAPMVPRDAEDDAPYTSAPDERLRSRERGADAGAASIFSPYTALPAVTLVGTVPPVDPDLHFRIEVQHTLGYLPTFCGAPSQLGAVINQSLVMAEAVGSPATPFPWFAWLDRPFANPYELLLVPSSSPLRVLYEYNGNGLALTSIPIDVATDRRHPVIPNTTLTPYTGFTANNFRAPYSHLLNFFDATVAGTPMIAGADFSRLLDLVETPSPFVNSHRWYNPIFAEYHATMDDFRPPYNRLSRFRDPGRININTIYDNRVWDAICESFPNLKDEWDELQVSRQGYGGAGMNANYPSQFNNPFRAAVASDLMPNSGYSLRDRTTGAIINPPISIRRPSSEATLLRTNPSGAGPGYVPLFDNNTDTSLPERYSPRNPFFRYQGLARLSNLVTNHSNVFAVRVTIGYFELEPWVNSAGNAIRDDAHPEGVAIGQEVGNDTGTVKRERAFFIIDRSIPVGFEPDENHNVDKAILVRRYIN